MEIISITELTGTISMPIGNYHHKYTYLHEILELSRVKRQLCHDIDHQIRQHNS